ncbi:MAG TPA: hypothetical protein VI199_02970 [Novosphingobium sp.]
MDTLRGPLGSLTGTDYAGADYLGADTYDAAEDEVGREAPPPAIGQDDRRMQVRAYNHWASLLGDRNFPLIADLETGSLPDFDTHSVLIDVTGGIEDPVVRYLGPALAEESGCDPQHIRALSDVPGRSLVSRITDHYLQIIANEAPIGFEAEFVNQRGRTILYRGILLPFSASLASTGVDLIYGVINWKELADPQTADELLQAIDQALRTAPGADAGTLLASLTHTAWADGPADAVIPAPAAASGGEEPLELTMLAEADEPQGLADLLASARELARSAQGAEDRTRQALYAALGRAHDFGLAALEQPEAFAELVEEAGLTMQARAPLIPVVKLVFGADYDKTRLTEYATVIEHARRTGITAGALAAYLSSVPGGLKGVLQAEREHRREASGKPVRAADSPREALTRRLRDLPTRPLATLADEGEEFTLILARRTPDGLMVVGELADDLALLDRAAKRLLD